MTRIPRFMHRFAGTTAIALALATPLAITPMMATPAHAFIFGGGIVFDPTNYAENVLQAARALEQIPADIAFIGFDDISFAAVYEPALTTIATPRRKMGELGAQMLLRNLQAPTFKPKSIIVDHQLVVRESCGAKA